MRFVSYFISGLNPLITVVGGNKEDFLLLCGFHFVRFPFPLCALDRLYHLIVVRVAFYITFIMFMIICHSY